MTGDRAVRENAPSFSPRDEAPFIHSRLPTLLGLAATSLACAHAPALEGRWSERVGDREVRIVLRYAPGDAAAAQQVRRALALAVPAAERWGRLSGPLTVTIHPTHEALEAAAQRPGHPWLRAWARSHGVELQAPRTWSRGAATDEELAQLLAHELTHCAMFQAIGGDARLARTIPVWFREGMATSNAGERFAGVPAPPRTGGALAVTHAAYRTDARRVYATADRAFRSLLAGFGEDRVRAILAAMRDGGLAFEDAFRGATGVSVAEFEDRFDPTASSASEG